MAAVRVVVLAVMRVTVVVLAGARWRRDTGRENLAGPHPFTLEPIAALRFRTVLILNGKSQKAVARLCAGRPRSVNPPNI